jgi:hypothetical protein
VASSSSIFNAQLAGHTSVDGVSRTAIEVTYSDAIPPGQHRGLITISTDDETYPTLQVPVILRDRNRPENEPVVVTPSVGRVIVDSAHPEKSKGTTITVTIPGHWKVSHLETFPSQLQGAIRKNEPGAGNTINVTVDLSLTELPATGVEQANLTLHATDGDEQEMVTVPITLLWR